VNDIEVEYAVIGAGAIGSILAAHLTRAGHRVALLARNTRAQQVRNDGLRITGLSSIATSVLVADSPTQLASAGTLIIATKVAGTRDLLQSLRHVRAETVLSIQNGVQKNELIAAAFGRACTLGALADISGQLERDGSVLFTRNSNLIIGELNGTSSARCEQLCKVMNDAGIRCSVAANITSLEWSKFTAWVGFSLLAIITRSESWKFLEDPDSAALLMRMTAEMRTLAAAVGVELSDQSIIPVQTLASLSEAAGVDLIRQIGQRYRETAPTHRTSALQDFEAGRPLEIHEVVGYATHLAERHGLTMPLVDALYRCVAALERLNVSAGNSG